MTTPFEFSDDLSELVQQVAKRLRDAGVDPDILSLVGLTTLARIFENRDDDLTSYLNDGLTAAAYQVSATTGTAIVTATPTALPWEAEDLATTSDVSWAVSPNPTRVTFGEGLWLVTVGIGWAATATGVRHVDVRKNGSTVLTGDTAPASTAVSPRNSASYHFDATEGDYLEAIVTQDSGTNKTATGHLHAALLGSAG